MKECCHQRLEAFVVEQVMVAFVGGKTTTTRENLNQKYNQPGVKSLAEGHTGGDACGDCTSNFLLISSLHHKNSHGESWRAAHRCLEQTQQQSDCPTHVLLLLFKPPLEHVVSPQLTPRQEPPHTSPTAPTT
ncbi:uncharacterized protein [Sinocyclocheilus grahami]|uniref:uncharacterized protein isoform X3 n=1 Tax=Sinocyclocheilus grahami TaxID=75366 RepID=UPI0007AD1785|nr:PREDICTED: uncharacterized protein LOC107561090 isoform X3 [Sinocyclocheilus grahami]